jgi:hypothetical protein
LAQLKKLRRDRAQRADFDPTFVDKRLNYGGRYQIAMRETRTVSISARKGRNRATPMPESILRKAQDFAQLTGGKVQCGGKLLINRG